MQWNSFGSFQIHFISTCYWPKTMPYLACMTCHKMHALPLCKIAPNTTAFSDKVIMVWILTLCFYNLMKSKMNVNLWSAKAKKKRTNINAKTFRNNSDIGKRERKKIISIYLYILMSIWMILKKRLMNFFLFCKSAIRIVRPTEKKRCVYQQQKKVLCALILCYSFNWMILVQYLN